MNPLRALPLILIVTMVVSAHASQVDMIEREVYAMGTSLRIKLFSADRDRAIRQLELILAAVEATEAELSTWRPESEVSRLNQHGTAKPFWVSTSLFECLEKLRGLTTITNGFFDPAIGRLSEAWKIHEEFEIPDTTKIESALHNSGYTHLTFNRNERTVRKNREVLLDVGGFGKGEALDRAIRTAEEHKLGPMLIDFGGQIVVRGKPMNEHCWTINVAHPDRREQSTSINVCIDRGSISTSGGSERDGMVNGKRLSHILNPKTGRPVHSFGSVTVWHLSALAADALSTALFVMGPEEGMRWATENSIAACFLVDINAKIEVRMTPEFRRVTTDARR